MPNIQTRGLQIKECSTKAIQIILWSESRISMLQIPMDSILLSHMEDLKLELLLQIKDKGRSVLFRINFCQKIPFLVKLDLKDWSKMYTAPISTRFSRIITRNSFKALMLTQYGKLKRGQSCQNMLKWTQIVHQLLSVSEKVQSTQINHQCLTISTTKCFNKKIFNSQKSQKLKLKQWFLSLTN
jgi:hypothetical protein